MLIQSKCPPVFGFREHKISDENLKIWRYMDYWKFESMIKNRSLYFCRSDNFPDKFEGSNAVRNIMLRKFVTKKHGNERTERDLSKLAENWKKCMFINCWSIDDYEDWFKWISYIKCNEGIAIQTTYKRLFNSIKRYRNKVICFGRINYIDYETARITEVSDYSCFLHKSLEYRNESELRAILRYCDAVTGDNPDKFMTDIPLKKYIYIPVDPDILIDKIYMHPGSNKFFKKNIINILRDNQLDKEISSSKLSNIPLF
jgi:hypothetical protein